MPKSRNRKNHKAKVKARNQRLTEGKNSFNKKMKTFIKNIKAEQAKLEQAKTEVPQASADIADGTTMIDVKTTGESKMGELVRKELQFAADNNGV